MTLSLVIAVVASALCIGAGTVAGQPSSVARASAIARLPVLRVNVRDGAVVAPDSVSSGWTRLHVMMEGSAHIVVAFRLHDGERPADAATFLAALDTARATPPGGLALSGPEVVDTGDVALDLKPGRYVLACMRRGADGHRHLSAGESKPFVVVARRAGARTAAAPVPTATVRMIDFAYTGPERWRSGDHWVRVTNEGKEDHLVLVARLRDGATLRDWTSVPDPNRIARPLAGAARMGPGTVTFLHLSMESGRYVLYCLIPHAPTGKTHVALGMFREIIVE